MPFGRLLLAAFALGAAALPGARAAEVMPPAPTRYFNDYAAVVRPSTAQTLNAELEQFEKDSSNQIVVAVFPRMESDSSVEDYTVRIAQSWRVGRKGLNNGAVLFVFAQEHQVYIQVGYGLEPKLPDITAKRIIEREIVPQFRAGDYDAGLSAGVRAMMAATRGEYQGTGRTVAAAAGTGGLGFTPLLIFGIIFIFSLIFRRRRSMVYSRRGPRGLWIGGPTWPGGFGGGGGGGSFGGGGGGGFSGGGGSFGGGGAGGKW